MNTAIPLIWMAAPPEVHSTLLSAGSTPAGIVAAGASWAQLAANYTAALAELDAVIMMVQATYQGPSAEQFIAAHTPMLLWLATVATKAAEAGATHAEIAAAFETALATMPTMPELISNHVTMGTLVATNFLGCNTAPIAATEADYQRMWQQAADVMGGWDATSTALSDFIMETPPAPQTMLPGVSAAGSAMSTVVGWGMDTDAAVAGENMTAASLMSNKLMIGKAIGQPASMGIKGAADGFRVDEGVQGTSEMAGGDLMQQAPSLLSSAPQALSSVAQAPSQMLSSAPQMLSSAPQQLSSMLGQFLGSAGSDLAHQSAMTPVGFGGTSALSGFNPAGATSLAGGALGGGPARPLTPSTWGGTATTGSPAGNSGVRAVPAMPAAAGAGSGMGNGMMGNGANKRRAVQAQRISEYTDEEPEAEYSTAGYRPR